MAAITWVADKAADLKIDRTPLGVIGDSAGGNLSAVVAVLARDRGGPSLSCHVLVSPVTDADLDKPSYLANGTG